MTDKELFEKTEKTFNLKQKTDIVNKVFNEGKFKQTLSEKSRDTSTSPSVQTTVKIQLALLDLLVEAEQQQLN